MPQSQSQPADEGLEPTSAAPAHRPADQASLLRSRYATQTPIDRLPQWNSTLETILSHRSVRRYLAKPLPPGTLELIVAAAQSASTSSNLQAWSVVAIEAASRKARLSVLAGKQKYIENCPLFLIFLADLYRLDRIAQDRGLRAEAHDYIESLFVGIIDAALAAQNAVVALESIGLASVYIGAVRNQPEEIAAEIGCPPNVLPVFGLCVGYPDLSYETAVKPRLPQPLVLHKEQYRPEMPSDLLEAYDRDLSEFQREQKMAAVGWTEQAVDRVKSVASLKGRDRLSEALRNLGFALR